MRYILLILLFSCRGESARFSQKKSGLDSLTKIAESNNDDLIALDSTISNTIDQIRNQIAKLSKEKEIIEVQVKDPVYVSALQYESKDERDKIIYELQLKVKAYEKEIARLKKRITDDSLRKVDRVSNEVFYKSEKPNEKSLVITLNKKIRGDGEISEQGVTVWIMPYNKRTKKEMKGYFNCQLNDLNLLQAIEAKYYNGLYFFNNILPGKYLIKVCALYGDYMVINRKDDYQKVEMQISPPIQ